MSNPALNATKHGLLSELPVLDGFETQEAWLAHRQAFWDDLQPCGAVEATLVERIALTFWRMARLARAEVAAARRHRDHEIERAGRARYAAVQRYLTLEEAHAEVRLGDDLCDWLAAYHAHGGDALVPSSLVAMLRYHLEQVLDDYVETADGPSPSAFVSPAPPPALEFPASTADEMRALFRQVAAAIGQPLDMVLQRVTALAQEAAAALSRAVRDTERQVEQVRSRVQLPADHELQLFTRYDAHLGRELARLFRTLRDLRAGFSARAALEFLPSPPETGDDGPIPPAPERPQAQKPEGLMPPTPEGPNAPLHLGPPPATPIRQGVKHLDRSPHQRGPSRRPRRGR